MAALAVAGPALAGDLTTDKLTVNKDGTFWANVTVKDPGQGSAPTNGLILYYSFSTNDNPTADSSGNSNTGAVNGATWSATNGIAAGGYKFNGSSDYISAGTASGSLAITTNKLSISAWIKRSTDNVPAWILGKMGPSTGSYGLYVESPSSGAANKLNLTMDVGGGWGSGGANFDVPVPNDGQWHHVAAVYNGTNVVGYVDNVASTPIACSGNIVSKSYTCKLGWEDGWNSQRFKGNMDEVRVYNRTLTASEVQGLYLLNAVRATG